MTQKVIRTRRYKVGYELRTILVSGEEAGGGKPFEMQMAYTLDTGELIGSSRIARMLLGKRKLTQLQTSRTGNICVIGYDARKKRWCGWSHRAICSFGIGDKIFEERYKGATDKMPFKKHGSVTIKTMAQAKKAAFNFAEYVS